MSDHQPAMAPQHGYCRDCKWWGADGDKMACYRIYELDSLAVISAFYNAPYTTITAPDFGCVQWEAKE